MVARAGDALGDMRFSGIFVPGLNRRSWLGNASSRVVTFFQTPDLRKEPDRVEFLPLSYRQISSFYRAKPPRAVLFMCSLPDEDGACSFGTETAFIPDHWRSVPVRIAHINPAMPRTRGDPGIPFAELTAFVEQAQDLKATLGVEPDRIAQGIARHAAALIEDGATLQTGLGKVPDAVLDALHDRQELRLHTGLVGDGGLRLVRSGAMASGASALVGVAIGSTVLYEGLDDPHFQFRPVSVTHDLRVAGGAEHFVAINSALEVDLFGQVYSEVGPNGAMSGPGGAGDFAAAARLSPRGLRVVCLPSTAAKGATSRIIDPAEARGPVSLSRFDTDIVVTEHGAADLRGKGHDARAEALIGIAAPLFQQSLAAAWSRISDRL
jgi:acyl-CoA hydrolase